MSQEQDALDAAYRRASAAAAGRPAAATRRAILEQAANAARARAPAANDSRFMWRAVAGVAVLGVAVLVWRQVDHRMPGQTRQVISLPAMTDQVPMEAAATTAPAPVPAPAQKAMPQAMPEAVPPATAPLARREQPFAAPTPEALPAAAPPAPEMAADTVPREADLQLTANESLAGAARAAAAPATELARSIDRRDRAVADLLREHFPAIFQSRDQHTVWLVRDAQGTVVMTGELGAAQQLGDITTLLQPTYGASLGSWRSQTVTNARNQRIVMAIAELRP
jgi:hypothetical protein